MLHFSFLKIELNLHNIKLMINHLKMHSSVAFSTFMVLCSHLLCLVPRHFHYPERKHCAFKQSLPPLPYLLPMTMTNRFSSLWIYLFLIFHINRTIQYVTFSVWLLFLSLVFMRFVHVSAFISMSFPFVAEQSGIWIDHILFIYQLTNI